MGGLRALHALLLVPYVAISSVLGLTGRWLVTSPSGAWEFFAWVWSESLAADAVFVVGSATAGLLAWALARRGLLASAVVGFAANAAVYVVSFLVLMGASDGAFRGEDLSGTVAFVVPVGIVGLAFAALAPWAVARWLPGEDAEPAPLLA